MTSPDQHPGPLEIRRAVRNLVTRADGKMVNVARKTGQLFFCATGCCCGHADKGVPPVAADLYHDEWERRKLRNKVHLTSVGCLGPCPLANVVMLLFDSRSIWFHSMNSDRLVMALYDYIEQMLAAQAYLPPPPLLVDHHFTAFNWEPRPGESHDAVHLRDIRFTTEGGFLFLTQADTDLLALSRAVPQLEAGFPPVKAYNLSHFKTEEDVDAFLDAALPSAEVIVLRLIGGKTAFLRGFDRIVRYAQEEDRWLVCLSHTDTPDPELTAVSNVGVPVTHECDAYLQYGGPKNYEHMLRFLSDHLLMTGYGYEAPADQPRHGVYHPDVPEGTLDAWNAHIAARGWLDRPAIGVLFYRSHLLSGNTDFVDALVRAGEEMGASVLPVYAYSLKEYPAGEEGRGFPAALRYFVDDNGASSIDALVSTMSFALGGADRESDDMEWSADVLQQLDIPVLQAMNASISYDQWAVSQRGLPPVDAGMNVAIPEFDGRIITVPISFKEEQPLNHTPSCGETCTCGVADLGSPVVRYVPVEDRVRRVVGQALRLIVLRRRPRADKRIAFMLTNYSAKASRIANAVGLDSPASLVEILRAMQAAGYDVRDLPPDGDALLHALIEAGSYDLDILTDAQMAGAAAKVPAATYQRWFAELPKRNQREMAERWEPPPGRYYTDDSGNLVLAGLAFGNVFVAIQPPRGYGLDPALIYHLPDLAPPHPYHALYRWLAEPADSGGWGADAVVHLGKHGTLEWLPGKGIGLSAECYPDLFLGDLPLVYPFIINNPGEGAQAKRRSHAVIIDHLTPPLTTAEGYGELEELSRLVDEYYQAEKLDPAKLPLLQQEIWRLIQKARLDADLGKLLNWDAAADHTHEWDPQFHEDGVPYTISDLTGRDFAHLVENINGYLCELTSALIRDGLHTFGHAPEGAQLLDTLQSLVRVPNLHVPSLRAGVADTVGLDLDAVLADLGRRFEQPPSVLEALLGKDVPTHADALEASDHLGKRMLEKLAENGFQLKDVPAVLQTTFGDAAAPAERAAPLRQTLSFVCEELVPRLRRTHEEVTNLLHALDGGFVPPGPSGAPTRGMAHILPTGRNFYTLDPRGIPSEAAWRVGQQLADSLVEKHLREESAYPESVGISIWGTSAMRTHGDDIAEVFALLGVRPRWQAESRRVAGFEVIPLAELGRPRIDVVSRISGFFRDAFPHLIALMDQAYQCVARLNEPPDQNFLRRHFLAESARLQAAGETQEAAEQAAGYRIFGCKPGAYGAGILPLIDEGNWHDASDFAAVYVNWGGYAYNATAYGVDARPAFRQALSGVRVAVKNQDNREHDIFDSDDYLQYHGGMIATIRALTGRAPRAYFGDSADPQRPKVRDLKEEALRVFRSRVVNPKWIASIQRHGYKGALELAATVDYLFGYDATSDIMDDWMYARVAETYALDPAMQDFMRKSNPWALKDIASRLLEAADRGLWEKPGEMVARLQSVFLQTEGDIEGRAEQTGAPEALRWGSRRGPASGGAPLATESPAETGQGRG